jgi:hypothetical protein
MGIGEVSEATQVQEAEAADDAHSTTVPGGTP